MVPKGTKSTQLESRIRDTNRDVDKPFLYLFILVAFFFLFLDVVFIFTPCAAGLDAQVVKVDLPITTSSPLGSGGTVPLQNIA